METKNPSPERLEAALDGERVGAHGLKHLIVCQLVRAARIIHAVRIYKKDGGDERSNSLVDVELTNGLVHGVEILVASIRLHCEIAARGNNRVVQRLVVHRMAVVKLRANTGGGKPELASANAAR